MKTQLIPITDNLTEVLLFILEFTQRRHKIIIENLNNVNCTGYVPKDLSVQEFAKLMDAAISEHINKGRLVLQDSANIRFGKNGQFQSYEIEDIIAQELIQTDIDKYIELQKQKLSENAFNSRLAAELLRKKQQDENLF
jgi:flagellar basal body rod protein FlgB